MSDKRGVYMVINLETINEIILDYVADVKNEMLVDKVYLFGSYAKGLASEHSDVDLCFFVPSFDSRRSVDIIAKLLSMTDKYNMFIEPHVFQTSDIEEDNPFVKEVLRSGREI